MSDAESVASQARNEGPQDGAEEMIGAPLFSANIGSISIGHANDEQDTIDPHESDKATRRNGRDTLVTRSTTRREDTQLNTHSAQDSAFIRQQSNGHPPPLERSPIVQGRLEMQAARQRQRASRVQATPNTQESVDIPIEFAAVCGLTKGKTMDQMWADAGSLRRYDSTEDVVVGRAGLYGDCLRLFFQLYFVVVTDKRFVFKKIERLLMFNYRTEETSYHYSNLQHVGVERGVSFSVMRTRGLALTIVTIVSNLLSLVSNELVSALGHLVFIVSILAWIYAGIRVLLSYNTNYLVIDISKSTVVGSWYFKRNGSYITLRIPLPVDSCFDIMNQLLKRHPLTPTVEDQV